jgi:hypothetical protein
MPLKGTLGPSPLLKGNDERMNLERLEIKEYTKQKQ